MEKTSSGKSPAVMADINDELLRLQNELDELSKQEELLAKRKQADDLR